MTFSTRGIMKSIIILLIHIISFTSIFAQTSDKKVYAVLVGVTKYNRSENNLHFAAEDAKNMYKKLLSMGVPATNMSLLNDGQATRANITSVLQVQFSKARPQDQVILFFSGHGGPGYLVTTDIPNYLHYDQIKSIFKQCKANKKMLFVDACYSGSVKDNPIQKSFREKGRIGIQEKEVVVFSASRAYQKSVENELYHGYFTYFLLKAFDGNADLNHDGMVTYKELFDFVNPNVKRISKGLQVPVMFGKFRPEANFYRVK